LVPAGARFCPTCGHAVASTQVEERRIVTVLFADLVGYSTLAEHLDPEQVKRLIDRCFERLVDDVTSFGGRVDKILGDGILALFGAPVAHEDDAERAVRAALRMQQTLTDFVRTSELAGSEDIRMRVGINTGEVLVGTLAGTDYTAMGDVVNAASRLQTASPPGGVLVGEPTHDLTSDAIRYEDFGEVVVRGLDRHLIAWLALEATQPPGTRRRRRRDVPLIGRDSELALAKTAFEYGVAGHRAVLLAISGDNGVGKSRLIEELIDSVRATAEAAVLEGACVPYGEANVWWPIASALATYLDLDIGQPVETVRALAEQRARKLATDMEAAECERLVEAFLHLLGYPSSIDRLDAPNARATVHRAVTRVLELRSLQRPVVLSITDLHWADPVLIALLEHLVASLSRSRFTLITAMRPGGDLVWPPRPDRTPVISLPLQPLSREDTEALTMHLLRESPPDARLVNALYERSGGNPLFLQELAALADGSGAGQDLPDSLRTLIGARLDQLTAAQRQILDNAAILGTSGAVGALERFAAETGQDFSTATLRELDELGLLEVEGRRWRFPSDSVRDTAYQTLTKAGRAMRHAGVAKAMAKYSPSSIDDLAHHTATAAELVQELGRIDGVPTSIVDRAIDLLSEAAERAHDAGTLRTAIRHATRALDLLPSHPSADGQRAALYLIRAGSLLDQRSYDSARADIDAMLHIAASHADAGIEADALRLAGSLHHIEGRLESARLELGRAVELLRSQDKPDRLARALRARGFIELFGGSLKDAEWFFGEADELYRTLGDTRGMAWVEQHRAWISFLGGDMVVARERLEHAAATLDELGDRNGVGWAFGLLAFVAFFERNFDEAEALAEVVRHEADERGDDWAAGMMSTLLADLRLWQGKLDQAMTLAESARQKFRKLNDKYGLVQAIAPLVRAQVATGQWSSVQRSSEELLALAESASLGPMPLVAAAGAAMHRGDGATALALAERGEEVGRAMGGGMNEPAIIAALATAQLGRLDEALALVDDLEVTFPTLPFANSVAALVLAMARDPQRCLARAREAITAQGATYLDLVFAHVGAGSAHMQLGDRDLAAAEFGAAASKAAAVGDVVAIALATSAQQRVLGGRPAGDNEDSNIADGWRRVIDSLALDADATGASAGQRV
jgi:class 3 adenylate cyclase/tetratricopeptide (TPR) repeat protein